MKTRLLFLLIIFVLNINLATAAGYVWSGNGSNRNWSNNANWLPNNGHPVAGDDAVIPNTTNKPTVDVTSACATIYLSGSTTITVSAKLTVSGTLTDQYGAVLTLSGNNTLQVNGNVSQTGGSVVLTVNAGATLSCGSLTLGSSVGIVNAGTITSAGNFNAGGASTINNSTAASIFTVSAGGITANNATAIVNAGTFKSVGTITSSGLTMTNSKTFEINSCPTYNANNTDKITNNAGATFTISNSSINFNGGACGIDNSGTFYMGISGSPTTFNIGNFQAYITNNGSGIFNLGPASAITFFTDIVNGTINTKAGSIANNGTFTIQSNINGSGAIGQSNGSALTGTYLVERYLSGGNTKDGARWVYRNYRLMSSPVNTVSSNTGATKSYPYLFQYLANSAIVTGAKGGYAPPSNFAATSPVGNPTIYLYREDRTPSNVSFTAGNFTGITDITGTSTVGLSDGTSPSVSVGNGFMFFFRGDRSTSVGTAGANKTTSPYVKVEPVTFTATGYLNQGTYTVQNWVVGGGSLKYENSPGTFNGVTIDNSAIRGYNLVGNPYASSIDWDTFSSTAAGATTGIVGNYANSSAFVSSTIWTFNPITNQYNTYIAGMNGVGKGTDLTTNTGNNKANIIASGQGFFVKALKNGSPTLTFYETAKAPTQQPQTGFLMMGKPVETKTTLQYMRLVLEKDVINNDDNLIVFNSSADTKYDQVEDAAYFNGNGAPESLSSMSSDNVKLAINRMPLPKQKESRVINLNVNATASGLYTFKRSDLSGVPEVYDIWLMDKYKKDSLDIKHNPTYAFNIDKADTNSFGSKRFQIVIRQNQSLTLKLLDFTGSKVTTGTQLNWVSQNENYYTNFTIERSTDNGKTFEVIGGFKSNGSGTYGLVDKNPVKGVNQYRLKQDDLDGTITYSKIVNIMYANTNNNVVTADISIYPNPVSSTLSVTLNNYAEIKAYSIKITNSSGIIVKSQMASQPSWQGNVSNLLPGTYIVQVTNNETKKIIGNGKFIKQ